VNRPSIVWLAARRQGKTRPAAREFHLDDARFAGRQTAFKDSRGECRSRLAAPSQKREKMTSHCTTFRKNRCQILASPKRQSVTMAAGGHFPPAGRSADTPLARKKAIWLVRQECFLCRIPALRAQTRHEARQSRIMARHGAVESGAGVLHTPCTNSRPTPHFAQALHSKQACTGFAQRILPKAAGRCKITLAFIGELP
jgi:hypothetical protein